MGRSSDKSSSQFWLLFTASIVLAVLVISLFLNIIKVMIYLLFVLVLVPIIFTLLKTFFAQNNLRPRSAKLKVRD